MTDEIPSPTTRMPLPDPEVKPDADAAAVLDAESVPAAADAVPASGAEPPSEAVPPATGWPPPATGWQPPHTTNRDYGRTASVVVGIFLLALGLWFFTEHTLGIDLPTIRWGQLWPLILIVVGGWVLVTAIRRQPR